MKMFRVAIVDDEEEIRKKILKHVKCAGEVTWERLDIMEFSSSKTLLFEIAEGKGFDLFLLDVELGEDINGMELARTIRNKYPNSYLIFVTHYPEYAIQGYSCKAYHYLLKDRIDEELEGVLQELFQEVNESLQRYYLILTNSRYEKILCSEIYYIEKDGKECIFHTCKEDKFVRKTLAEVYEKLPQDEFVYIERRYVVNLRHLSRYENNVAVLRNGIVLPVSRTQARMVREKTIEYWRREI